MIFIVDHVFCLVFCCIVLMLHFEKYKLLRAVISIRYSMQDLKRSHGLKLIC